jgi:hypothetical protein
MSTMKWVAPAPRRGWPGQWDSFIGPGATRAENALILGAALAAGVALPLYAGLAGLGWTALQLLAGTLIAADLAGGVVANAAAPAKAWYHRAGQGLRQHLAFILAHGAHLFVVAWLFRGMDWTFFAVYYGYLVGAALVVLLVPLYVQRPVAFLLYAGALVIHDYTVLPVAGLEWFVPIFFLKLLIAYLLREAPYRPDV